jgi:hypothetical protein
VTEPASPDDALAQLSDRSKHDELARAIQQLSPEEAAYFLVKLEIAIKKRRIQIAGYLFGLLAWVVGMWFALAYYGVAHGFVGWVFLVPFALFGMIIYAFGRWANRLSAAVPAKGSPAKGSP